ncbi:MAG: hypothetical protein FWC61_01125 [Proteobacteria bacterium]|nr:hypothetical protein [Pseudomonadota bacterium]
MRKLLPILFAGLFLAVGANAAREGAPQSQQASRAAQQKTAPPAESRISMPADNNPNPRANATPAASAPRNLLSAGALTKGDGEGGATRAAAATAPVSAARVAMSATASRAAALPRAGAQNAKVPATARSAAAPVSAATLSRAGASRAAALSNATITGAAYVSCRNNYFTCMDQFCAQRDANYRRCICSSRLTDIRQMQRVLAQTQQQLLDFQDYNINSVDKTSAEVKAMLTATSGEYAAYMTKDTSSTADKLAGISSVLAGTRTNALSTAGTLDIAGDINAIWNTTDFISGADIATLEGDKLYNAVHNQCYDLVAGICGSAATLNMVVSAYGMQIEQDCNTIMTSLNQSKNMAQTSIRQTERELNIARLQNYNVHNAADINACIAQVRADINADTACGANYVHCLDLTGKFLNYATGEPIYSPEFYRMTDMLSLDGDVLKQPKNQMLLSSLNKKKIYAKRGLDTCRDIANDVWTEFLRQAITEIYQQQYAKVRQVKDDCVAVVTQCYDLQRGALRDFSQRDPQALLGQAVATTEDMCKAKLDTCSNLYGGGPNGMQMLLDFVRNTQTALIADNCQQYLESQIQQYCSFKLDTVHPYPFSCRVKPSGSWKCTSGSQSPCLRFDDDNSSAFNQTDSLFYTIAKLALENCMREKDENGVPYTTVTLSTDVQKSVQITFDNLFNNMWGVLGGICRGMGGEWVRRIISDAKTTIDGASVPAVTVKMADGTEKSIPLELPQYTLEIHSDASWGQCQRTYCNTPGDMYVEAGQKKCCDEGYIRDPKTNTCVMADNACPILFPGSHLDPQCKVVSPDALDAGCVAERCRCDKGLVKFQNATAGDKNFGKNECKLFYCDMVEHTVKDDACVFQTPGIGGCLTSGCRCDADPTLVHKDGATGWGPAWIAPAKDDGTTQNSDVTKVLQCVQCKTTCTNPLDWTTCATQCAQSGSTNPTQPPSTNKCPAGTSCTCPDSTPGICNQDGATCGGCPTGSCPAGTSCTCPDSTPGICNQDGATCGSCTGGGDTGGGDTGGYDSGCTISEQCICAAGETTGHCEVYTHLSCTCYVPPTFHCDPGYYMAANSSICTGCRAGYYCPGGTFSPASYDQGRESCPVDPDTGEKYLNSSSPYATKCDCYIFSPFGNKYYTGSCL